MAYPTKNYNAISGAGTYNTFTAGGATVGDDQSGVGGTESTAIAASNQWFLLVPVEQETDETILGCEIESVKVVCKAKRTGSNGQIKIDFQVNQTANRYGGVETLTTSYVEYSYTWTTNPGTGLPFTWDEINASAFGCYTMAFNDTYLADHTYITITYKLNTGTSALTLTKPVVACSGYFIAGTSAITLPKITLACSGRFFHGTSALTLIKPVVACSAFKYDIVGTADITLPILTTYGQSSKIRTGTAILTLPLVIIASTGCKKWTGTSTIILPFITYTCVGCKHEFATSVLTLPLISITSFGVKIITGTSVITLKVPILEASFLPRGYKRYSTISGTPAGNEWQESDPWPATTIGDDQMYSDGVSSYAAGGNAILITHFEKEPILQNPIISLEVTSRLKVDSGTGTCLLHINYNYSTNFSISSSFNYYSWEWVPTNFTWTDFNKTDINELVAGPVSVSTVQYYRSDRTYITVHYVMIYGPAAITLPVISIAAQGHRNRIGTAAITLPVTTIAATGNFYNESELVNLTLPIITLSSQGIHVETGTSTLILPVISFVSSGYVAHVVTSNLTLPQIIESSSGYVAHVAICAITLPICRVFSANYSYLGLPYGLQVSATGCKNRIGSSVLTLPFITFACVGVKRVFATCTLQLPFIQFVCIANKCDEIGTAAINLPILNLVSIGHKLNEGSVNLTLPSGIALDALGHRVLIVIVSLRLPVITVTSNGFLCPRGVETDIWLAYKQQMRTCADLNYIIRTWKFHRVPNIYKSGDLPLFVSWPENVENEEYSALPADKFTSLVAQIRVKIYFEDQQLVRSVLYSIDDLIKQTLDSNLQLTINGVKNAVICHWRPTSIGNLSNNIGELRTSVELKTARFHMGDRTESVKRKYVSSQMHLPRILSLSCTGTIS